MRSLTSGTKFRWAARTFLLPASGAQKTFSGLAEAAAPVRQPDLAWPALGLEAFFALAQQWGLTLAQSGSL
jgi:hypothetical protein